MKSKFENMEKFNFEINDVKESGRTELTPNCYDSCN